MPRPDTIDLPVAAAMTVLAGSSTTSVAEMLGVEAVLVERWRDQFVAAGRSGVMNRPSEDEAHRHDRFLAVAAHEIRSPLTVMNAAASMLKHLELDPAAETVVASMQRSIDRLRRLADMFDEAASASLGRQQQATSRLALHTLVAERTGLAPDGDEVFVEFDPHLLGNVVDDLLTVFGPDREPTVTLTERDGWAELAVTCRPGLPERTVAELLDPFAAPDDATAVTFGLYRARAVIVAGRGHLGATGGPEHTTFWVRLPSCGTNAPHDLDGQDVPTTETANPRST